MGRLGGSGGAMSWLTTSMSWRNCARVAAESLVVDRQPLGPLGQFVGLALQLCRSLGQVRMETGQLTHVHESPHHMDA